MRNSTSICSQLQRCASTVSHAPEHGAQKFSTIICQLAVGGQILRKRSQECVFRVGRPAVVICRHHFDDLFIGINVFLFLSAFSRHYIRPHSSRNESQMLQEETVHIFFTLLVLRVALFSFVFVTLFFFLLFIVLLLFLVVLRL